MPWPFLQSIKLVSPSSHAPQYLRSLGLFVGGGADLEVDCPLVVLTGQNGTGKTTLLDGLACHIGFPPDGGTQDHLPQQRRSDVGPEWMELAWAARQRRGFYLRGQDTHALTGYLDSLVRAEPGMERLFGGKKLESQSHGESLLSLFQAYFRRPGIYILDEPEAGLSPESQFALVRLLRSMEKSARAQVLIATHSPILACTPGARVFELTHDAPPTQTCGARTGLVQTMAGFMKQPELFFHHLLKDLE